MKLTKKVVSLLLALTLLLGAPIHASAYTEREQTTHYGWLRGTITQAGTILNTTTSVTSNTYNGTLHTKVKVTDGIDTTISTSTYKSSAGALTLSRSIQMVTIIRAVAVPGYAAYTPEIRGGDEVGHWFVIDFEVDSSAFN